MTQNMLEGKITGCTFFKITFEEWDTLEVGQTIKLERDKNNPYDKNAIKVVHNNRQIGWVGKPENQEIAEKLDNNVEVVAEIKRIFGTPMDRPHVELNFY